MSLHAIMRRCLPQIKGNTQLKRLCRLASTSSSPFLKPPHLIQQRDDVSRFLDSYDTFLLDCDGVLWDSYLDTSIPGIPAAIDKLHELGKTVIYVTNNSLISRIDLKQKFQRFGFDSSIENIFTNGHTAAVYIKDILKVTGKVYLVGGQGMKLSLDDVGLDNFGVGPDFDELTTDANELLKMKLEDNVEAVLVGFDHHINYNKIFKAASYLTDPACHFVATNDVERGVFIGSAKRRRMPMVGMMVNAVSETSGRSADIVGKPRSVMFDCLTEKHPGVDKCRTVMIGDSLKADIGFAKCAGIDSALVLTGNSNVEQIRELPHLAPTYVINSLADFAQ